MNILESRLLTLKPLLHESLENIYLAFSFLDYTEIAITKISSILFSNTASQTSQATFSVLSHEGYIPYIFIFTKVDFFCHNQCIFKEQNYPTFYFY